MENRFSRNAIGEADLCPFRYPGQYEDSETGLYYNRFRYFDPELGQYTSVDPIGLAGGNPTLFGYVGDTNMWVDPFGLINAPVDLPDSEGIYILTNGKESYVGSAGIGEQGMNKRISSVNHIKAQKLLDTPGTKVQFVKVDLGTATSKSDRNNILRYYEAREYQKQTKNGFTMLNGDKIQSSKKKPHAERLIAQHGASAKKRRTSCKGK